LLQKNTDQHTKKTRFDRSYRSGIGFWSEFFKTNIMMAIQVFI
jgi:hypothetical protein